MVGGGIRCTCTLQSNSFFFFDFSPNKLLLIKFVFMVCSIIIIFLCYYLLRTEHLWLTHTNTCRYTYLKDCLLVHVLFYLISYHITCQYWVNIYVACVYNKHKMNINKNRKTWTTYTTIKQKSFLLATKILWHFNVEYNAFSLPNTLCSMVYT